LRGGLGAVKATGGFAKQTSPPHSAGFLVGSQPTPAPAPAPPPIAKAVVLVSAITVANPIVVSFMAFSLIISDQRKTIPRG
jgi:hypothetical protein